MASTSLASPWIALGLLLIPAALPASRIELISAADPSLLSDSGGGASTVASNGSRVVSSGGRLTVFTSVAANLAPGQVDTNQASDVFLYDRTAGTVTLISHSASGTAVAAHGNSDQPVISGDGNRVAYVSTATDLVAGQVIGASPNVFLWDRATGINSLVSHAAASAVTPASRPSSGRSALSQDGRWILFASGGTDLVTGQSGPAGESANLFLYDAMSGTNVLVTHDAAAATAVPDGGSEWPVLSADGRYAAYHSSASNLVSGYISTDGGNMNVYLWDRTTGANILVSHVAGQPLQGGSSSQFASISADGRWIVYESSETHLAAGVTDASNLTDVFLYDRDAGTNQLVDHPYGTATTTPAAGADAPVISGDGNWITFRSSDKDLVAGQTGTTTFLNLFQTERATGDTTLVSHVAGAPTTVTNGSSLSLPSMSTDGRWIAYDFWVPPSPPGVDGREDIFLYDRAAGTNTLVSHRAGSATGADANSFEPSLSDDGGFVAFASDGTDLDSGARDANGARDVYLYDRAAGTNDLLSRRDAGLPSLSAGGDSANNYTSPVISHDGRWIAFTSAAANLVTGQIDTNGGIDVFLRDRTGGTTILVSRSTASATQSGNGPSYPTPAVSEDGRWVAFSSSATDLVSGQTPSLGTSNVFLFDRLTGTTTLVSHSSASATTGGNGDSYLSSLSADGSRLVFVSTATDLVAGATDANAQSDVFLYDRTAGSTTLVSHAAGAPLTTANAESLSSLLLADGSGVIFQSRGTNLIAGQNDSNGENDLFFFDPASGSITLISHVNGSATTAGNLGAGSCVVSRDGRWILYDSLSSDLIPEVTDTGFSWDVFLYDRKTGTSSLVSHAAADPNLAVNALSFAGDITPDGRWLAFISESTDLVRGQTYGFGLTNVFLQDRLTGTTTLVSHVPNQPAGSPCCFYGATYPRLSGDGSKVAYSAGFLNLVTGQDSRGRGVFLYDRLAGETALVSHTPASPTQTGDGPSDTVTLSADGGVIAFTSTADDLVPNDYNNARDIFVYTDGLPGVYYTVPPCRLFDTRLPADGPALVSGQTKIVHVHGVCGIPDTAKALAVNITIVQPTGDGYLTLHPGDVLPTVTSTVNFTAGQVLANNAAQRLAVNTTGTMAMTPLVGGSGTVHVVIDVAGYFE